MALVTVLKGLGKYGAYIEDRAVLTIVVGFLGSLAASFGILSRFEYFLETLTNFAVPLIGIMGTDYFILKNTQKVKGIVNISAMMIWIGLSFGAMVEVIPGGSLMSVFYAAIFYYGMEKIFGNKLHIGRRTS